MLANHRPCFFRLLNACSLLLLSSAIVVNGQTVSNVTGTINSQESLSQYGFSQDMSLQLQGSNFALDAFISSNNLVKFSSTPQFVTINPAATTSDVMPLIIAANPGFNSGTLTYNETTYSNLQISLNINAEPAVVANDLHLLYQFGGVVAAVPFSL